MKVYSALLEAFLVILPVVFAGLGFIYILHKQWFWTLRRPIDNNFTFGSRPIFGKNKTWLGVVAMSVGAGILSLVLSLLFGYVFHVSWYAETLRISGYGFLLGLAYSLGELPNSFLKRRIGIAEGKTVATEPGRSLFRTIDIVDSVVAVGVVAWILYDLTLLTVVSIVLLGSLIHIATDFLMYTLRLKKYQ